MDDSLPSSTAERLRSCLGSLEPLHSTNLVLRQHLDRVTGETEAAARALVRRLTDIAAEVESCQTTVTASWDQARQSFDAQLQRAAHERAMMVQSLRELLGRRHDEVRHASDRWQRISEESDRLQQHIAGIEQLAAQSKILAINARIEASRAGGDAATFTVVAEEMRRLSNDVESMAGQVGRGVGALSERIRGELAEQAAEARAALRKEEESIDAIADRLENDATFESLGHTITQLIGQVSDATVAVGASVLEALASIQFQDITRQRIEQVLKILDQVDEHVTVVVRHADDPSEQPVITTSLSLESLSETYVMHTQRQDHAKAMGLATTETEGPAIELF